MTHDQISQQLIVATKIADNWQHLRHVAITKLQKHDNESLYIVRPRGVCKIQADAESRIMTLVAISIKSELCH